MLTRSLKTALVFSEKILFFFISFYSLHLVYISYSEQEITNFFYMLSLFGMFGGIYNLTVPVILNQDALKEVEDPDSWFVYLLLQVLGVAVMFFAFNVFDLIRGGGEVAFIVYLIVSFKRFEIFIHFLLNYGNVYAATMFSVVGRLAFIISLIVVSKYKVGFYFAYFIESLLVAILLSSYLLRKFRVPKFPRRERIIFCVSRIKQNKNILYSTLLLSIYMYLDAVILGNYLSDTDFSSYTGVIRLVLAVGVISSFISSFLSKDIVFLFNKSPALFMGGVLALSIFSIFLIYYFSYLSYPYLSILYGDKWSSVNQYVDGALLSIPIIFLGNMLGKAISLSNINFIEPIKQAVGVILYIICIPIFLQNNEPDVLGWLYSAICFCVYIFTPCIIMVCVRGGNKKHIRG